MIFWYSDCMSSRFSGNSGETCLDLSSPLDLSQKAHLLLLHVRLLLLLLLLHVGGLLLLLHRDLLLTAALVELVARLALLDGLGRLGADVDGADGLAVRVQRRARVLALVARTDGVDLRAHSLSPSR